MSNYAMPVTIAVEGTLTADLTYKFSFPDAVFLRHVSGYTSNDSDLHVSIGQGASTVDLMAAQDVGDGTVVATFSRGQDEIQPVKVPALTEITVTVDFDGQAGTAGQDLMLVILFTT